jgi:glycerophosphoryl diester phosphodiesterase
MSLLKPLPDPIFSKVVNHRGAQIRKARVEDNLPAHVKFVVHPENTLAAFEEAFKSGHDIELDVNTNGADFFQRNGKKVEHEGKAIPFLPIFHDDELGAITGVGNPFKAPEGVRPHQYLRDLQTEAIQNATFDTEGLFDRTLHRIGKPEEVSLKNPKGIVYLDKSEKASHIPTLDEVFTLLKKYPDRHAFVELKTITLGEEENFKGMDQKTLHLIKAFNIEKQVTVISFNRSILEKVNTLAKEMGLNHLKTGYDIHHSSYLNELKSTQETLSWAKRHVSSIMPWYREISKEFVDSAHKLGLKVFPYPRIETREEEKKEIARVFDMGVDGVICNIPSDAEEIVQQHKSR